MTQLAFDLDIDKHHNATLVIACGDCGHEMKQHLRAMRPESSLRCPCGSETHITTHDLLSAQKRLKAIKTAYQLAA